MFSAFFSSKSLWVCCLVASVLMCLLAAPTSLEAQSTTPSPSTSSGSSGETEEGGTTSGPPPVDERDEDDVSLTFVPFPSSLEAAASPNEVEPTEPGPVARFWATLLAGPRGWLEWIRSTACRR